MPVIAFDKIKMDELFKGIFGEKYYQNMLNHYIAYHLKKDYPYYPEIVIKNNFGDDYSVKLNNSLEPELEFEPKGELYIISKGTRGKYGKKKKFFQKIVMENNPAFIEYKEEFLKQRRILETDMLNRAREHVRNLEEYLILTENDAQDFFIKNNWRNVPNDFEGFKLNGWKKFKLNYERKSFDIVI